MAVFADKSARYFVIYAARMVWSWLKGIFALIISTCS